jgi:RNA polymerase sigma-70 factor (ECF subfamily)
MPDPRLTGADEQGLLAAAKGGDEGAFGSLVDPYRRELRAHAYRMLGSAADAEEALQEALIGAWRGLPRFEGRSSLRSWLHTITANAALKAIRGRPSRTMPIDHGPEADPTADHDEPLAESVWIEPMPDELLLDDAVPGPEARYEERESVELAFVAALQHLPPRQRAALIMRDVLDFSARETAEALDTTPVSIDSALQRAHKTVDDRLPERSQQQTLRSLTDAELRDVVDGYVRAFESADVPAVAERLAADVVLSMPPLREWYTGRANVSAYYGSRGLEHDSRRLLPTRANGQPAAAHYTWREEAGAFLPHAIQVFAVSDDARLSEVTVFVMPWAFPRFGLPERLEG